jgi:hypothetical protein
MSTDLFTGSAATLVSHDANWALADTASGEVLTDLRIDGSGFCIQNASFGNTRAFYTGTTQAAKSEIVVPIGAFVTLPSSERVGVFVCGGTGSKGLAAEVGASQLTGQVVGSVRIESNGSFVVSQTLSPTIDTATVALTMSVQRTSTTNLNLIVNGTTYPINTTGVDIATGSSGMYVFRNSATATTVKLDSWTDGVAGGGGSAFRNGLLCVGVG